MDKPTARLRPPMSGPRTRPKVCEHKYRSLDRHNETSFADGKPYLIHISTVFYCEKCLDIKHRNETIHIESD